MTVKERRVLLDAVVMKQGDICLICREMPVRDKTLDHLNGKKKDDRISNLVLLCRGCNSAEGNRIRNGGRLLTPATLPIYNARAAETLRNAKTQAALAGGPGARVPMGEWVCEGGEPGVDRRGWGSTEEAANLIMEPTYRLWLFRWVKKNGAVSRADAIDAGAEYLDQAVGRGSQATIERYFRKIVSTKGWLEERRGTASEAVWGFRTGVALEALESLLESRMRGIAPAIPTLEVTSAET